VPTVSRFAPRRNHLVVCGDDKLAAQLVEELTGTYGGEVTVLLRSRSQGQGPKIARLPRVRVIERAELDADAFAAAGVQSARSLALLRQDDLGNFHAALRAQELNPDLRLVIAIFNTRLGERIRTFFRDCAVLSGSSMSAPSFVAAALGEPAPSHVRLAGRTLYVARRTAVSRKRIICGLAMTADPFTPQLLPPSADSANLVLAVADGATRDPLASSGRRLLRSALTVTRALVWHKLGFAFLVLFAVGVSGFALLATAGGFSLTNAAYLTSLDAAGAAVSDPALSGPEKVAQVMLTFDGMALLPVLTAAVVGARLTGSLRTGDRPHSHHVIVVGLGHVGTRAAGQLHDLGFDVVCVDKNESAPGIGLARRLRMGVVIGESHLEETLQAAGVTTCRAVLLLTSSDTVNLETALLARALAPEPRIVLRLTNDDLAQRVQEDIGNTISRSVSYMAAPAFAAAMLEHQVLRTIPVGRHVLLIADVTVSEGSELAGMPVENVHQTGQVRVLALQRQGGLDVDWSPARGTRLAPGDRLYVLATRGGLSGLRARGLPPPETPPAPGK
jgi:Trk K+ transport system NAD-binding subunit